MAPAQSPGTRAAALGCGLLTTARAWAGPETPGGRCSRARGSVRDTEPVLLKRKRALACPSQPTAACPGDREGV